MWRATNGDNLADDGEVRELVMTEMDFQRANELAAEKLVYSDSQNLNFVCPSVLFT